MHHLTRSTIAASTLILAVGAAVGIATWPKAPALAPAPPTPAPVTRPAAPTSTDPDDPDLTQRRGEWSPICSATSEPLIDFSPVDVGNDRHRILLTVHNCSAQPVELVEPLIWLGGREGMTDYLRLDRDRTNLSAMTLPEWESAQAVLTWEPGGETEQGGVLSVRLPGIGEGEVRDAVGLTYTSRAWLSGWTR